MSLSFSQGPVLSCKGLSVEESSCPRPRPICDADCQMELPSPPPDYVECNLNEEFLAIQLEFCRLKEVIDKWRRDTEAVVMAMEEQKCCFIKKIEEIVAEICVMRDINHQLQALLAKKGKECIINLEERTCFVKGYAKGTSQPSRTSKRYR